MPYNLLTRQQKRSKALRCCGCPLSAWQATNKRAQHLSRGSKFHTKQQTTLKVHSSLTLTQNKLESGSSFSTTLTMRPSLVTTRRQEIAVHLARNQVIELPEMSSGEARDLLRQLLVDPKKARDDEELKKLFGVLCYHPLAIAQAANYFNMNRTSFARYLSDYHESEEGMMELLGNGFDDDTHHNRSQSAVATTWLVSFKQVKENHPAAERVLSFISWIEPKAIPRSILPDMGSEQAKTQVIGTLEGYGFLTTREGGDILDMHSLVHTIAQRQVRSQGVSKLGRDRIFSHLYAVFPTVNGGIVTCGNSIYHTLCKRIIV